MINSISMQIGIHKVKKKEYSEIIKVWEASVRATHDFLLEEDIIYFQPCILKEYLKAVNLRCTKNATNKITGFLGASGQNLEMLFIHPEFRGKHFGKNLLHYAVDTLGINEVDVNEQNEQAVGFYLNFGFKVVKRSALDQTGKPYPVLHMKLKD